METRKLHVTLPRYVYDYLREHRLFSGIDGIVTDLLIEYFGIEKR